jgi:hypothetical protein
MDSGLDRIGQPPDHTIEYLDEADEPGPRAGVSKAPLDDLVEQSGQPAAGHGGHGAAQDGTTSVPASA